MKKIFLFFRRNEIFSFLILLIIIAAIGYFSTLTNGPPVNLSFNWMSTAYHFLVFFLFTFFLFLIIANEKINQKLFFVLIISLMTAMLDETHQIFVPFRDASIKDVLIDYSGSVFSAVLFYLMNKKLSD